MFSGMKTVLGRKPSSRKGDLRNALFGNNGLQMDGPLKDVEDSEERKDCEVNEQDWEVRRVNG